MSPKESAREVSPLQSSSTAAQRGEPTATTVARVRAIHTVDAVDPVEPPRRAHAYDDVLQLQRTIGNRAVVRLLSDRAARPRTSPLPASLKAGLEHLSGEPLDDVMVHHDSPKPRTLSAAAYTQGRDIYLAPGQERHLAHEAWHAVQQKQGRVAPTSLVGGAPVNADAALEREADEIAADIVPHEVRRRAPAMPASSPLGAPPIQRKIDVLVPDFEIGPMRLASGTQAHPVNAIKAILVDLMAIDPRIAEMHHDRDINIVVQIKDAKEMKSDGLCSPDPGNHRIDVSVSTAVFSSPRWHADVALREVLHHELTVHGYQNFRAQKEDTGVVSSFAKAALPSLLSKGVFGSYSRPEFLDHLAYISPTIDDTLGYGVWRARQAMLEGYLHEGHADLYGNYLKMLIKYCMGIIGQAKGPNKSNLYGLFREHEQVGRLLSGVDNTKDDLHDQVLASLLRDTHVRLTEMLEHHRKHMETLGADDRRELDDLFKKAFELL